MHILPLDLWHTYVDCFINKYVLYVTYMYYIKVIWLNKRIRFKILRKFILTFGLAKLNVFYKKNCIYSIRKRKKNKRKEKKRKEEDGECILVILHS